MTMTDIDDPLLEIEQRELAEKAEEPGTIKKMTEEMEWSWRQ